MRPILYILFLCSFFSGRGQRSLQAYIVEAETAEGIISALVYDRISGQHTLSNVSGYFSLSELGDSIDLRIQALGYEEKQISSWPAEDSLFYIYLEPISMQAVEVLAEHKFRVSSSVEISPKQLEQIPHLGGERDLMKALSIYPGISNSSEGSAQLIVRGGNNGQNLILLDGSIVYNANHFAGFLSVFNADAIKQSKLYKGGFPAEFGGRLSSILDIRMREGSLKKWKGRFGLGLLSSRLSLEGPIIKDKLSFMLSGRATYWGWLSSLGRMAFDGYAFDNWVEYNFYDLNAKLNYRLAPKHSLYLSFYRGQDISKVMSRMQPSFSGGISMQLPEYADLSTTGIRWGNRTATLRYHGLWSKDLFSVLQLGYSHYQYKFDHESREYDWQDSIWAENSFRSASFIKDLHFKWGLNYQPSGAHQFKFGLEGFRHQYQPYLNIRSRTDSLSTTDSLGEDSRSRVWEAAAYLEGRYQKGALQFIYGLRYSAAYSEQTWYHYPEPRLAAVLQLSSDWALRGSASRMVQYIHLLANNGVGFPNDIWVPITNKVKPQTAWQYSLAALWKQRRGWEIEVEAYYKQMDQLIDYQYISGGLLGIGQDWQEEIARQGKGRSYGLELLCRKQWGPVQSLLSYSLSKTYYQFASIDNNRPYPFKYDRPHQLSALLHWQMSKHWDCSASWTYNSGQAITLPVGRVQGENSLDDFFIYAGRNNARMPDYHRLDLSIHYQKKNKKGNIHQWSFDIYNAYNRQNPFALFMRKELIYLDQQFVTNGYKIYQLALFPILPSVSYDFKF